jgi:hypothetical protein
MFVCLLGVLCLLQERELVADLMNRLDVRTAERNEALSVAAAAEGRIKVRPFALCTVCLSTCRVVVVCGELGGLSHG